jgi:hypothetical protein
MFMQSMPGEEGSPEARANKLELELQRAQNRIAALEAAHAAARGQPGFIERKWGAVTGRDGPRDPLAGLTSEARKLVEDIRDGRPVDPEEVFHATKPAIQIVAPILNRVRIKEQKQAIDSMAGEFTRKYNLSPQSQDSLKEWFRQKAEVEAKRWSDVLTRDDTGLQDVIKASRDVRPDDGLDAFMPSLLRADQVAAFSKERMDQRAQRVEREADMKVNRLNSIVPLDETQREQVFGIAARGSHDYDPSMRLESGTNQIGPTPGGNPQAAMLAILRPDQRAIYEAEQQRRHLEAAKDAAAMGIKLPPSWNVLDDDF